MRTITILLLFFCNFALSQNGGIGTSIYTGKNLSNKTINGYYDAPYYDTPYYNSDTGYYLYNGDRSSEFNYYLNSKTELRNSNLVGGNLYFRSNAWGYRAYSFSINIGYEQFRTSSIQDSIYLNLNTNNSYNFYYSKIPLNFRMANSKIYLSTNFYYTPTQNKFFEVYYGFGLSAYKFKANFNYEDNSDTTYNVLSRFTNTESSYDGSSNLTEKHYGAQYSKNSIELMFQLGAQYEFEYFTLFANTGYYIAPKEESSLSATGIRFGARIPIYRME